MQEKGTSVATALAVLVFLKQKIIFCYVSLSKRGKCKTDLEGHVFQEKWKRVHLFVVVKTFYVLKCRHLASLLMYITFPATEGRWVLGKKLAMASSLRSTHD